MRLPESDAILILLESVSDFTILSLSRCLTLFLTSFYRVNICLLFVNKRLHPSDLNLRNVVPEMRNVGQIFFYIVVVVAFKDTALYIYMYIIIWNTFKILQRHGSISINRQFTSAMEKLSPVFFRTNNEYVKKKKNTHKKTKQTF